MMDQRLPPAAELWAKTVAARKAALAENPGAGFFQKLQVKQCWDALSALMEEFEGLQAVPGEKPPAGTASLIRAFEMRAGSIAYELMVQMNVNDRNLPRSTYIGN